MNNAWAHTGALITRASPRSPRTGRAQTAVNPSHLAFEPLDGGLASAVSGGGPPRAVLVEHVREKVLLFIREAIEERKEVRLVAAVAASRTASALVPELSVRDCTVARGEKIIGGKADRSAQCRGCPHSRQSPGLATGVNGEREMNEAYRDEGGAEAGQLLLEDLCREP